MFIISLVLASTNPVWLRPANAWKSITAFLICLRSPASVCKAAVPSLLSMYPYLVKMVTMIAMKKRFLTSSGRWDPSPPLPSPGTPGQSPTQARRTSSFRNQSLYFNNPIPYFQGLVHLLFCVLCPPHPAEYQYCEAKYQVNWTAMQAYSSVSDCPTTIGPPIGLTFEAVRGLLKRNPCQQPAKLLKRSCLIPGSFSLLKGNPSIWMESSFNCCQRLFGFWETPQLNCLLLCMYSLAHFDTLCQFMDFRTHMCILIVFHV